MIFSFSAFTPETKRVLILVTIMNHKTKNIAKTKMTIGMNGQPIKKYLAEIENKLGKPLSNI